MKELLVRQRELTARLNVYRDEYYNKNAPSVSDAVYDRLFDELVGLEEQTGVITTAEVDWWRYVSRAISKPWSRVRLAAFVVSAELLEERSATERLLLLRKVVQDDCF